jgi:O-antigen ligase
MRKWLSLENLIYLAIVLLPAYLIRFSFFGVPTNALEALVGIIFIVWLTRFQEAPRQGVSTGEIINEKYFWPVALIFIGLLSSTVINGSYITGLGIIKGWFLFPILISILAKKAINKERMVNVFWALYASSFLVALASLGYLFMDKMTYDGRLQAFFNSPNYLAMYLAPGIIVGMILAQDQKEKNKKTALAFSGSILLMALYLTFSYAAWLAVAISLMIVFLIRNKLFSKKIVILAAIVFSLLFLAQYKSAKFNSLADLSGRSSSASRLMIWKSAEKMLEEHWLFGIGPGNFQSAYLDYQKYYTPYLEWAVPHPHSLYLAFWLYGGIIGLLGFLILLRLFLGDILKGKKNPAQLIALGIIIYILIHGLLDTTYFKNDLSAVFWLCFIAL